MLDVSEFWNYGDPADRKMFYIHVFLLSVKLQCLTYFSQQILPNYQKKYLSFMDHIMIPSKIED